MKSYACLLAALVIFTGCEQGRGQSVLPLVARTAAVVDPLGQDQLIVGGLKPSMQCDEKRAIYAAVNRGRTSVYGSVYRMDPSGRTQKLFDSDDHEDLADASVESVTVASTGTATLLVREVAAYNHSSWGSNTSVAKYGKTYGLQISAQGSISLKKELPASDGEPVGIASLTNGGWLLVRRHPDSSVTLERINQHGDAVQLPTTTPVLGDGAVQVRVGGDGTVVVSFSRTQSGVLTVSPDGATLHQVTLHTPQQFSFSAVEIANDSLLVEHVERTSLEPLPGGLPRSASETTVSRFDLRDGHLLASYRYPAIATLACFDGDAVTFLEYRSDPPAHSELVRVETTAEAAAQTR